MRKIVGSGQAAVGRRQWAAAAFQMSETDDDQIYMVALQI